MEILLQAAVRSPDSAMVREFTDGTRVICNGISMDGYTVPYLDMRIKRKSDGMVELGVKGTNRTEHYPRVTCVVNRQKLIFRNVPLLK